ncbi:hypothetical protein SAZ11_59030 [Streptomyces sp. FXJ1.4098]|nr:hypothetical protein [Streptomyces sp. FXJ1.4098]
MERCENVIIDHCSFSWAVDEVCSPYGNENVTMQWCVIAEGLTMSAHEKGRHGYGGLWGGDNVTYHHNLLVHNGGRNPRFSFVEDMALKADHRNNVIYNYGYTSAYGGEWADGINIVGNYYKPGPNTVAEIAPVIIAPTAAGSGTSTGTSSRDTARSPPTTGSASASRPAAPPCWTSPWPSRAPSWSRPRSRRTRRSWRAPGPPCRAGTRSTRGWPTMCTRAPDAASTRRRRWAVRCRSSPPTLPRTAITTASPTTGSAHTASTPTIRRTAGPSTRTPATATWSSI